MNRKTKCRNKLVAMLLALMMGGSMTTPLVAQVLAEALPAGEAVQMDDGAQGSGQDSSAEAEGMAAPEDETTSLPENAKMDVSAVLADDAVMLEAIADDEKTNEPDNVQEDISSDNSEDQSENTPAAEPDDELEPTQEPATDTTTEPTQEPAVEPTADPTSEPTQEPTTEPTQEPTTEPSMEPTPSPTPIIPAGSYTITVTPPAKWQTSKATAKVKIADQNGTGWAHIKIVLAAPSAWMTVVDGDSQEKEYTVTVGENSTLYVSITDHAGNVQAKSEAITCFDAKAPTVRAGISGEMICIEASDEISGVEAVFINGHRLVYKGDTLDARIEEYADGKEKIAVQAVDKAGNFSETIYVTNPFYGQQTATPKPTPKPTKKPSSSGSGAGTSGGSGTGNTGNRTTPTPTSAVTQTPVPAVAATPPVQQIPAVTAVPTVTVPAIDADMITDIAEKVLEGMISAPSSGSAFAMNGNMKTLDLLYSKATNKQFISVQTKQGETYYIVIDYDKPIDAESDLYETYFLNLVDDYDLLSVLGNQATPEPSATPVPTLAPTPTPTPKPTAAPEGEKKDGEHAMLVLLLMLTLLIGGGAAALVFLKRKDRPGRMPDIDDLDFDDDDEVDEDRDEP